MESGFSNEYWRRKELMETLEIPTMSELKMVAGLPLALVMFEESHPELRQDFGLAPPLEGPGDELWVSPSDLLIGKVALKPPLTQKHIQALTHQGILEIGGDIEQKFLNEMRIEKEAALQELEEYLKRMFEVQKSMLLSEMRQEEQSKYMTEMEEMRLCFENRISQLLWECYEQVKQLEEQMQIEIDSLNILWQDRLEDEIKETVERITEEFLEKMRLQEQVLVSIYSKEIRMLKMKHKCAMDFERTKCKEIIIQLRHKLHCENIADLMYLLCKERKKCKSEKTEMRDDYLAQIKKQRLDINRKSRTIKKLVQMKNKKMKQLDVRERCLIEILKQFQKFIYFALRAAPTQGEFLLNLHRLIKFEIDDYCIYQPKPKRVGVKGTMTDFALEPVLEEDEIEEYLRESRTSQEQEFEASDVLPAFYFNDKMYVREDFRDRFAAGIDMDRSDSLWNPDVEELLEIFRKTIAKRGDATQMENVKSYHSSVHFSNYGSVEEKLSVDSVISPSFREKQILSISPQVSPPATPASRSMTQELSPRSSTTRKSSSVYEREETEIRKVSLAGSLNDFKKEKRRQSVSIGKTPAHKSSQKLHEYGIRSPELGMTQSRLTLARDSVILHISTLERKSIQYMSKIAEESLSKGSTDKEKTSGILRLFDEGEEEEATEMQADVLSQKSLESVDAGKTGKLPRTSRLLLANDSYELIKSTITLVPEKEKEHAHEGGERRKSQLTFNPKIAIEPLDDSAKSTKKTKPVKGKKQAAPIQVKKKSPKTPRLVAKVLGSRKMKEQDKGIDEFTNERIKSLVHVMKQNPSLIRLFTPCAQ